MAVSITISIDQNSQSVANNTSNVTVGVRASWTGGSYNLLEKSGYVVIDGTKYTFTSPFNTGKTSSGTALLYSKTLNIKHGTDGKKTLKCTASYTSGVSSGTVAASASKELTTIARASSLTASNGTLGTKQTLKITEQASTFKHKITYTCGSVSGYAAGSASAFETANSIDWTPPLNLASQNTTGTTVTITLYLKTYNSSGTLIGSVSKVITCAIPASVKPSCAVSVTDPTGYADTYGAYIKGLSKLKVEITPTTAYGSDIVSYNTTANGATYTAASFTTGELKYSGELDIVATVKDKRGRSGSDTATINALAYIEPVVARLAVNRCNEDGTENDQGSFVKVTFTASVTDLNELNTATYILRYKKTTEEDTEYIEVGLDEYANVLTVEEQTYVFAAETGSSYNVALAVTDNFKTTTRATTASTAFTLIHYHKDGTGIAFGKLAEEPDLFDFGLKAKFNKPVYGKALGLDALPGIPENSDFNNYMEPGCYAVHSNAIAATCANIPIDRAGRLEVWSATGEGVRLEQWSYLRQRFIPYNSTNAVWERDITRNANNVWTYYDWWQSSLTPKASKKVYDKAAIMLGLTANSTLSVASAYTQISFNSAVMSTNDRLTLSENAVRIGANIEHIKVSANITVKCGAAGTRHFRIQKISGSTTSSIAWVCVNAAAGSNTMYPFTPVIVPVKEGDLIRIVYYTADTTDYVVSGNSSNGRQSYLTVEEL